jgi:hypothetical protein
MSSEFTTLAEANKSPELEDSEKLDQFMNQILVIESFDVIDVGENKCCIMKTDKGKISSFSKVIFDQLHSLKSSFDEGKKARLKPVMEKRYHKFEDVEN